MERFLAEFRQIAEVILLDRDRFYGRKYGQYLSNVSLEDLGERDVLNLPSMSFEELSGVSYKERSYPKGFSLNRIIQKEDRSCILSRSMEEIEESGLRILSRPLIALGNVYDAVEFSLYYYSKGILPLMGEIWNEEIIYSTANKYNIDGMICDRKHYFSLSPRLCAENKGLKNIVVIDSFFEAEDYLMFPEVEKDFVLEVEETGRIAYLCKESEKKSEYVFHPFDDAFIEPGLTKVTSSRLKTSPLIRYQTDIFLEEVESKCSCNLRSFRL